MTPPIERRPTLRKATVPDDVVAGLTGQEGRQAASEPVTAPAAAATAPPAPQAPRRGPGRPRGRRRMEPFSSKIEIDLRDQVDAYVSRYGESYVDLLDRALRAAITAPPPER